MAKQPANRTRRIAPRVALIVGCALVAVGAPYLWRRARSTAGVTSQPPAVQLEALDLAVARAIESARVAVQHAPDSGAAWGKLGMVFLAHDLPAAAITSFAQAEHLDRREPRWAYYQAVALSSGQPEAAIPKLRRAAELCGKSCSAPRLRLGELLLNHGQCDDAENLFRRVLEDEPNHPIATLGLARVCDAQNKIEEALRHARRAAGDVHTARAAHQLLAKLCARSGNRAEALAAERQANLLPEDTRWRDPFAEEIARLATGKQARISHADQLLSANRVDDAIVMLRQIVHDYPESDWAWLLLGRAHLMNRDVAEAEEALRRAVQLAPDSVLIQYHLGVVALGKKEYRGAAAFFRRATELQRDFAPAHCDLGSCLFAQGDRSGAEEAFRTALRCKPDYPDAHIALSGVLLAKRQQTEAIEHLKRALELNPGDVRATKLLERIETSGAGVVSDKR